MDKKGQLEVEVIRARGLTPKPGSKSLPGKSVLILILTQIKSVFVCGGQLKNCYSLTKSVGLFIFIVSLI